MYQKESPTGVNESAMENLILNDIATSMPMIFNDNSMIFTPTTFAQFESTLNDLNNLGASYSTAGALKSESSANQLWVNMNQQDSDYDDDDDDSDDSNSNTGEGKRVKNGQMYSSCVVIQPEQRVRKLPGPRPSRTIEEMTPIEAERRRRRRERNKNAAAKCRQRRVDQTNELLAETEQLEQESVRLEREIELLRRQKHQLEFVLEAHKPTCQAQILPIAQNQIKVEKPDLVSTANLTALRPNTLAIQATATCRSNVASTTNSIFSFDTSGFTPMFSGDMSSPSSYLISPSALLAQQ
jgi:hypothetical protein